MGDINMNLREKLLNGVLSLFKIRTIITLGITVLFIILALNNELPTETTTMVIGMVFTYYFNHDKT